MPARRRASTVSTEHSEDIFLSPKRKKKAPNTKKANDDLEVNSLFGELVTKAGFILKKGDQPNLLSM